VPIHFVDTTLFYSFFTSWARMRPPASAIIGEGAVLGSIPVLRQAAAETDWNWQAVAVCERAAALILLLLAIPLLAVCALVLGLLSGCTPLIAHRRVGFQGAPLWMLKLRTMWDGQTGRGAGWIEHINDDRGPELKDPADSRVPCRFARFCRRHSIDELPQLWHVISGEMSLVGPRPITQRELHRHYGAHSAEVLQAKPGLAGLWQISGRNRLTYAERCRLDLELVRQRSIPLYCSILLRTVPEVFRGKNSW
jgi:lipopolysaccharide/colanic/teichoic acid biosynthesis glycosyltransferase